MQLANSIKVAASNLRNSALFFFVCVCVKVDLFRDAHPVDRVQAVSDGQRGHEVQGWVLSLK